MESERLETRLGPLAWRSSGRGPTVVFFAGALANGDLWRDVVVALEDRYRCITIDLPLGAHPWPLYKGADRSATSLARLLLDCLELLEVEDATVVANDTAGGLLLLSLATGHPALGRAGRLVLTNCDNYDQFPPDALRKGAALCRTTPDWPERCFGYSCDRRSADARSSPASPRVDWTTSAKNRSSGQHDVIKRWSTISSRPWVVSDRNSSSMPPRRSPGSTGR